MGLCTKRQITYLALTFPAVVYLFLMFTAIGQVCFKTDTGQTDFKERYLQLVKTIQRKSHFDQISDEDSRDLRKLLHAGDLHFIPEFSDSSHVYLHKSKINEVRYDVNTHHKTSQPSFIHNCSSISQMKVRNKIGHGVSKQAFIAEYQGTQVAIKMVTRHIHEVRTCLEQLRRSKMEQRDSVTEDLPQSIQHSNSGISSNMQSRQSGDKNNVNLPHPQKLESADRISLERHRPLLAQLSATERQRCYIVPTARLMKEVLLSQQLQHHNLATLLGYCVRSEESDSTDISEHGVISVYELGSRFVLDNLQILPWQTRLRHALEMADLLHYLQFSPLGSLVVPDFKEGHFVMVNGSLKLIDLDDVNNIEPECDVRRNGETPCPYSLRCVRALCEGFNAKENLKNMNKLVLKRLLFPLTFPQSVISKIGEINADLDSLALTAGQLTAKLLEVQDFLTLEGTS